MKNIFLAFLGLIISICFFVIFVGGKISSLDNKYKINVGSKYILEKDTLTVVDYSLIKETFTLSNGTEINASLILNKKP